MIGRKLSECGQMGVMSVAARVGATIAPPADIEYAVLPENRIIEKFFYLHYMRRTTSLDDRPYWKTTMSREPSIKSVRVQSTSARSPPRTYKNVQNSRGPPPDVHRTNFEKSKTLLKSASRLYTTFFNDFSYLTLYGRDVENDWYTYFWVSDTGLLFFV